MSVVLTGSDYFRLDTDIEVIRPIKDQIARIGKVGVMLERDYLQKPRLRLDIYEQEKCSVVGASTDVDVFGKDMDSYNIDNKYVRLLASSRLHEAIDEALIYYRYEMQEYLSEVDATKPLNVLKNFCIDAEIPVATIIATTIKKIRLKGLGNSAYSIKQTARYKTHLGKLEGNQFFIKAGELLNIGEQKAQERYAEGVLAFWLYNHLEMDAISIDENFDWEDGKAAELLSNHIFFILELHRAIENNII
jgi:hypothetical protein